MLQFFLYILKYLLLSRKQLLIRSFPAGCFVRESSQRATTTRAGTELGPR